MLPLDKDVLHGLKEISAFLRVGYGTVARWSATGYLPVYKVRGRVWARRSEMIAWLESHRSECARPLRDNAREDAIS